MTQAILYPCCSSQKKSAESCVRYPNRDQVARIWRDDHGHKAAHPESEPASLTRRSDIYVSTYSCLPTDAVSADHLGYPIEMKTALRLRARCQRMRQTCDDCLIRRATRHALVRQNASCRVVCASVGMSWRPDVGRQWRLRMTR